MIKHIWRAAVLATVLATACAEGLPPEPFGIVGYALHSINGVRLPAVLETGSDDLGPYTYFIDRSMLRLGDSTGTDRFIINADVREDRGGQVANLQLFDEGSATFFPDTLELRYDDGTTDRGRFADSTVFGVFVPRYVVRFVTTTAAGGPLVFEFHKCTVGVAASLAVPFCL